MPLSNSIGVIDSGIDYGHVDLAANVWVNPLETPGNGLVVDRNPVARGSAEHAALTLKGTLRASKRFAFVEPVTPAFGDRKVNCN